MLVSSFLFLTTFPNKLNFESIEDTRNFLLSVSENWKKEYKLCCSINVLYVITIKRYKKMKQTDKNIKEIRIYHSLWKNILLTVGCFAFAAGGYFILHDANTSWPTKVFGGIGSMVFFGCGGMLMFMMTLYNITTHIPFLIIHDDRLDIYEQRKRTYRTIYFKDVEQFRLIS